MKEIARFNYRGTSYRLVVNGQGEIGNQILNKETLEFETLTPEEMVKRFTMVDNLFFMTAMVEAGRLGAADGTQPKHFMEILGGSEAARYGFSVGEDRQMLN